MAKLGNAEIWTVGGGKGGVGKTIISSNLGIDLAQRGYKVILIDADFGCANLHTSLGITAPTISISDFVHGSGFHLEDILIPTRFPNLTLGSGAQDVLDMANPKSNQQGKLLRAINNLNVDYVIIDLGAGTSSKIIDFFLLADQGIMVTMPEPTSIENTYRFLKAAFYKKLKSVITHAEVRRLLERLTTTKSKENPRTPSELVGRINHISEEAGRKLRREIDLFHPKLVINQARTQHDIIVGHSMKKACLKYFGIDIDYVAFIENDEAISKSIRLRQPVMFLEPSSKASVCIRQLTENLLNNSQITALL